MGLLKHGVLPVFAAIHSYMAKVCLIDDGLVAMLAPSSPPPAADDGAAKGDKGALPPTPSETHLTRIIGGGQLVFVVNAVVAMFHENAHYRGMAVLLEAVYFSASSYSFWKAGRTDATPIYCMLGMSLVGLGVHAMEPGVFTRDKAGK